MSRLLDPRKPGVEAAPSPVVAPSDGGSDPRPSTLRPSRPTHRLGVVPGIRRGSKNRDPQYWTAQPWRGEPPGIVRPERELSHRRGSPDRGRPPGPSSVYQRDREGNLVCRARSWPGESRRKIEQRHDDPPLYLVNLINNRRFPSENVEKKKRFGGRAKLPWRASFRHGRRDGLDLRHQGSVQPAQPGLLPGARVGSVRDRLEQSPSIDRKFARAFLGFQGQTFEPFFHGLDATGTIGLTARLQNSLR